MAAWTLPVPVLREGVVGRRELFETTGEPVTGPKRGFEVRVNGHERAQFLRRYLSFKILTRACNDTCRVVPVAGVPLVAFTRSERRNDPTAPIPCT